jgi:hypothetical protein
VVPYFHPLRLGLRQVTDQQHHGLFDSWATTWTSLGRQAPDSGAVVRRRGFQGQLGDELTLLLLIACRRVRTCGHVRDRALQRGCQVIIEIRSNIASSIGLSDTSTQDSRSAGYSISRVVLLKMKHRAATCAYRVKLCKCLYTCPLDDYAMAWK